MDFHFLFNRFLQDETQYIPPNNHFCALMLKILLILLPFCKYYKLPIYDPATEYPIIKLPNTIYDSLFFSTFATAQLHFSSFPLPFTILIRLSFPIAEPAAIGAERFLPE